MDWRKNGTKTPFFRNSPQGAVNSPQGAVNVLENKISPKKFTISSNGAVNGLPLVLKRISFF
jgi:hypothetical protein